jgi:hypothetical protein
VTKGNDQGQGQAKGPKYHLDIEGTIHDWDADTITVPQIRDLGNLPAGVPVLQIDAENNQVTLAEDAVVQLKPGMGFSKKVKYARGAFR